MLVNECIRNTIIYNCNIPHNVHIELSPENHYMLMYLAVSSLLEVLGICLLGEKSAPLETDPPKYLSYLQCLLYYYNCK